MEMAGADQPCGHSDQTANTKLIQFAIIHRYPQLPNSCPQVVAVVHHDWLQLTGPRNAATRGKGEPERNLEQWQVLAHWGRAGGRVGEHTDVGQIAENLVYKFENLPNCGNRLIGYWMFLYFLFIVFCIPLRVCACLLRKAPTLSSTLATPAAVISKQLNIHGLAPPLILFTMSIPKQFAHATVVLPGKPGAVESSANPGIGVKILSEMEHLSWDSHRMVWSLFIAF